MKTFEVSPIGLVHSPFKEKFAIPRQPGLVPEARGILELLSPYDDPLAVRGLDGFSHIWVIFVFHRSEGYELHVRPYLDEEKKGVFACRAPRRPNPIGISLVKLEGIDNNILNISGLDMLDGSPVLDIKPHVVDFDEFPDIKIGWLQGRVQDAPDKKGG